LRHPIYAASVTLCANSANSPRSARGYGKFIVSRRRCGFRKSAGDMLDSWFESDPIKAVLGFDAVVGNLASPYTAGSAYMLLHHAFGEVNGKPGVWGLRFRAKLF
jgi:hypothetical protein